MSQDKGFFARLLGVPGAIKGFLNEVVLELKKCSWPTWPELKQSTVVVIVSMLILGAFVGVSDFVVSFVIKILYGVNQDA